MFICLPLQVIDLAENYFTTHKPPTLGFLHEQIVTSGMTAAKIAVHQGRLRQMQKHKLSGHIL
jgi:hypothetical protein